MNIVEVSVKSPKDLLEEIAQETPTGVNRINTINTTTEKFVYDYCRKILKENDKDEVNYNFEYVLKNTNSDEVLTKYDIEHKKQIVDTEDAFHTGILCLNDVCSKTRIFVCDINTDKYKYKLFDDEDMNLIKIKQCRIVQMTEPRCYGIISTSKDPTYMVKLLIIKITEKNAKNVYRNIESHTKEGCEFILRDLTLVEKDEHMKLSKKFYNTLLYKKECNNDICVIINRNNDIDNIYVQTVDTKTEDNEKETTIDETGNISRKFLQRMHTRKFIQNNVCNYMLGVYKGLRQIELSMDHSELIKLLEYYFEDLYKELKTFYNIDESNMVNMKDLKIVTTKKMDINSTELRCLVPLEMIKVKTSDNMKYEINIGDLFIYFGEELVFDTEKQLLVFNIGINP